jgi:hypothetical protein
MSGVDQQRKRQADSLYDRYAKPTEAEHIGQYVAVSSTGQVVFGETVLDVADKAARELGRGVFVFKVGDRAVWRWR